MDLGLELRLGLRGTYSPLWCHNDVIIYLALGYEVLRKRKYGHTPRNAYVSNVVIEYSTLTSAAALPLAPLSLTSSAH